MIPPPWLFLLLLAAALTFALPAPAEPALHELRAARRGALRAAIQAKADAPAVFGLLVIPVDFADLRFAAGFDPAAELAPRLADQPAGALGHYLGVASQGRTALAVTLAPVISLAGTRQDYSDIGWQGNERSRRLAREALQAARERGVDFASADGDGDGEVDGVLLLHAAPGLENDPAGLILPLQFFLGEAVVDRGTLARSYAVAAARSGLGIWAHETAHLMGLEDRYDPGLPGDGEAGPSGGLGRFSLMASGWLGSGAGEDPALPDAYSRLSVGWADLASDPEPGKVVRPRRHDPDGPEYFLAEQRDPAATAPYDAGIPADRLLIYHVDEELAEGQASSPTWPRHLRVQLVEADGGTELARGEDDGAASDLFPFANQSQRFADQTIPDSRTWEGASTGVDVTVTATAAGLSYSDAGRVLAADLRLPLVADGIFRPVARLPEDPLLPDELEFTITVENPEWGTFTGGVTATGTLVRTATGGWENFVGPDLAWQASAPPPPGSITRFSVLVAGGELLAGELAQVWDPTWSELVLDGAWPGAWRIVQAGDDGTTWHRWLPGPSALPSEPMLAATGAVHATPAAWPEVSYGNDAHAVLESPLLGTAIRWVSLSHSPQLELLYPGSAVDGVTLTWVHAGGAEVPATPVDAWIGSVDPRSRHALAGAPTFAVADSLDAQGRPRWRREALALPDPVRHGPGPWRLRLELASNPIFRDRGWLLRDLDAHLDAPPASAFPLGLDAEALRWSWPVQDDAICFTVQRSDDGGRRWTTVAEPGSAAGAGVEHSVARGELGLRSGVRARLRVLAGCAQRTISRSIIADGGPEPTLSLPRPNPCSVETSVRVDGDGDVGTEVGLFDLRGRRVRHWRPGGDPLELVWLGDDAAGRRVAAGVYIFRMRAHGRTLTRKVTWLP